MRRVYKINLNIMKLVDLVVTLVIKYLYVPGLAAGVGLPSVCNRRHPPRGLGGKEYALQ